MRGLVVAAFLAASVSAAGAQYRPQNSYQNYGTGSNSRSTYVDPHYRRNGDFVDGHYRTAPNNSRSDNYGAYGNSNPYTGNTTPYPRRNGF